MRYLLCLLQLLALVTFLQCKGQCSEKKKIKLIKKHLDTLKDALLDLGCETKPSKRIEKVEKSPNTISTQTTKAPPTSPAETLNQASSTAKRGSDDICSFTPEEGISKNITCFLSEVDMENGLNLEKFIGLKLCTDIIMLVKHSYEDVSGKSSFQYLNQTRESANVEKWRSMNLRIFMQIGSWGDSKRLTGAQFSRFLEMPKARDRFVNALANYLQQNTFDGLLISWYFPGCQRDDCKTGPMTDDPNSIIFFKKFVELAKEKSIKLKIAVEASIRKDNMLFSYKLSEVIKYVDLLLFENTSPDNRAFIGNKDFHNRFNRLYEQFGTLDDTSKLGANVFKVYPKVVPGNTLMELETTTVYSTVVDDFNWRLKNITAKNLCKLVLSAPEVVRNTTFKWPLNLIQNETETYPFNDFDYMKARVDEYVNKLRLGGVWIRDLWADDMDNECNCGAFPILRAANEAVGRSTCKLPNCPTNKKI